MKEHHPLQFGSGIHPAPWIFSLQISYKVRLKQSPSRDFSRREAQTEKFWVRRGGRIIEDNISKGVSSFREKQGVVEILQALNQSLLFSGY